MFEFWCFIGALFTIAFIIFIIAISLWYVGEGIPEKVVLPLIALGMIVVLCWSQAACAEAHNYVYSTTDRQEKIIEILAEATGEDKLYIAGVVILCDEELSIAEMLMAVDGNIAPEDAEAFEHIVEMRLKELDDKD